MNDEEQRAWTRYEVTLSAQVRTGKTLHPKEINDLSAGGASLRGATPSSDIQSVEVALDRFGSFPAAVVRGWNDGFAVSFDLDEDEKYSLQEDVEAFMRENDLMDDE